MMFVTMIPDANEKFKVEISEINHNDQMVATLSLRSYPYNITIHDTDLKALTAIYEQLKAYLDYEVKK